jgi:hypothetical protein
MLNKETIAELLLKNDKAVARALLVLNANQTADEQVQESVKYQNGKGFRPCHARMGTSMANFYQKYGYLSPKQLAYWRKLDASGTPKLAIYWKQLVVAAEVKAAAKTPKIEVADIGNLLEEYATLEELYQEAGDTCDEEQAEHIAGRMIQIREQIEEINRCEYKYSRMA